MFSITKKSCSILLALIGMLAVLSGCTHRQVHQVGSHQVTIARHGFQKKLDVNKHGATLEYAGVSAAGEGLKVSIAGDKVKVNGRDFGKLRPGDSVLIGDHGVGVNSLDYGESEKYLRANNSSAEGDSLN